MDQAIEDIKEKSVDGVKEGIKLIGESLTEVSNAITDCKGAVEDVENILSVLEEGPLCRGPGVQPRLSPPTHPAVIGAQNEAVLAGYQAMTGMIPPLHPGAPGLRPRIDPTQDLQLAGGSGLRGTTKGKKKPKKKVPKKKVRHDTLETPPPSPLTPCLPC